MGKLNESNNSNPPHAQMNEVPQRTDDTVRMGLTAMPARYMARGLIKSISDSGTPGILRRYTSVPFRKWLFEDPLYKKLNEYYAQFDRTQFTQGFDELQKLYDGIDQRALKEKLGGELGGQVDHLLKRMVSLEARESHQLDIINHYLSSTEEGKKLEAFTEEALRQVDAHVEAKNTLQYAILKGDKDGKIQVTRQSTNKIGNHLSGPLFECLYDNALGLGSLWMTYTIHKRVLHDIRSIYSEVVAYEKNKDPGQVTDKDIFGSDNQIIQQTAYNFRSRQAMRAGMSAIPFIKNIPRVRAMQLGEIGLGAWGLFWAHDVWGRQPTMLESISDFVNDKLNPRFGIGDPIRPSDIINLYQQYALKFRPERAFQSVGTSDLAEDKMWLQSQGLFREIATLMNESYNYKHVSDIDPNTGLPVDPADFKLPKYVYLLGNDLINIHEPEWSMAYIKIANEYGMEAVKEVARAQERNIALNDILKKYPVDLNQRSEEEMGKNVVRDSVAHVPKTHRPDMPVAEKEGQGAIEDPHSQISTKEVLAEHPKATQEVAATH